MRICLLIAAFCLFVTSALSAQDRASLLNQAEQLLRSGHAGGALPLLTEAAGLAQPTAESEDRIGFLLAVMGRQPEAIEHFERALLLDPNSAAAHYHLGVALWLKEDPNGSVPHLMAAVRIAPGVFDYRLRLGTAYLDTGHEAEAVLELKKAAALNAASAMAWNSLGHALQMTKELDTACQAYEKAVRLSPNDDLARNDYGFMLVETRRPDEGIAQFRTILEHDAANSRVRVNLGYAHLKKGEFSLAERQFQQALEQDPSLASAHYNLGIALKQQDKLDEAKQQLQDAVRLEPSLAEAHYTLGITCWQLSDLPQAISELRAATAIRPQYAEAHAMLGITLKQSGDSDSAIVELREAIRLDPTTPGPFNTLGQILRVKGDQKGSNELFAAAAKLKRNRESQLNNALKVGMK